MARNRILVPEAKGKLDEFKMEVAKDMAIEYKELQNSSSILSFLLLYIVKLRHLFCHL
ncbi:Small, acid-soluble spore protein, alpha/beta type [Clostridium cochlearium]|uniref:Small, acid-soluble spore protein, alpha/beta type n=1 Tax=Clostridium cochlearium TaxID=1494 RepID=A0ABY0QIG1_CLOCO|nr:Small, acid-soluble spore protein, alpha/beta type [Clostridium cochlearium]